MVSRMERNLMFFLALLPIPLPSQTEEAKQKPTSHAIFTPHYVFILLQLQLLLAFIALAIILLPCNQFINSLFPPPICTSPALLLLPHPTSSSPGPVFMLLHQPNHGLVLLESIQGGDFRYPFSPAAAPSFYRQV